MKRCVLACLVALSLSGCTISANLNTGYRTDGAKLRPAPLPDSLAVQRFVEDRPPRVYTTGGRAFLTYVPLIPYVDMPFERLDESALKAGSEVHMVMPPFEEYTYPASMAEAVADHLRSTGLFQSVKYVGTQTATGDRYVLSGKLRASPLEKDMTSYGLGIAGVYLWILPIPAGQVWASLTLELALADTKTGQVVWQRPLQHEISRLIFLYTSAPSLVYGGQSSFDIPLVSSDAQVDRHSLFAWHFEILRQAMAGVPAEISTAVESR